MVHQKTKRKENTYISDENLGICRITTSLSKTLNPEIKLWKTQNIEDIKLHAYEVIIDNDEKLIELLRDNYLVFYDNSNDIRRSKSINPKTAPHEKVGYFWAMNIHSKERIPLGRLIWEYKTNKKLPYGYVIDHGNDCQNLCIMSNISPMTQTQNKSKLRYTRRIIEPYSITLISHPNGLPIKLLRFKDDEKCKQELLIYNTENGIDEILDDINSFKTVIEQDSNIFKQHFEKLKKDSKSYFAHIKQSTTGDLFSDEIYNHSINWKRIDKLVIEKSNTAAIAG